MSTAVAVQGGTRARDVRGFFDRRPWLWLLMGGALIAGSQVRSPVGVLAWFAPVPWLRYLRLGQGWRSRVLFGGALMLAWTVATAKIASEVSMLALAPAFALPIALAQLGPYLLWRRLEPRVPHALAVAAFALAMALGEWALYSLTPFGSWGATAYSQLDDLPLLQVASVFGIVGVGAVVNVTAAAWENTLARGEAAKSLLALALAMVLLVHVAGTVRLALADSAAPKTVRVAAIATDSNVRGLPLPSREATHAWDHTLFERTRDAARGGAELAVWPEAATLVWPDEEAAWLDALEGVARTSGIDIVAAYVVPSSSTPFAYRNEFRLARRDGGLQPAYAKHHPVPGEPAIAGRGPAPVVSRDWGMLSGAICFDYDFPAMGLERARRGVDLVALPASDWRGIDPVHSQMAAVRAIESGHSILRSTRFGLSLAVDGYGRPRAWHSSFEPGSSVMFADLPRAHTRTLYARWGDSPLALTAVLLAVAVAATLRGRTEPWRTCEAP